MKQILCHHPTFVSSNLPASKFTATRIPNPQLHVPTLMQDSLYDRNGVKLELPDRGLHCPEAPLFVRASRCSGPCRRPMRSNLSTHEKSKTAFACIGLQHCSSLGRQGDSSQGCGDSSQEATEAPLLWWFKQGKGMIALQDALVQEHQRSQLDGEC